MNISPSISISKLFPFESKRIPIKKCSLSSSIFSSLGAHFYCKEREVNKICACAFASTNDEPTLRVFVCQSVNIY